MSTLGSQFGSKRSRKNGHKAPMPAGSVASPSLQAAALARARGFGLVPGSSSSWGVGHSFTTRDSIGRTRLHTEALNSTAIQVRQVRDQAEYNANIDSMTTTERTAEHSRLTTIHATEDDDNDRGSPIPQIDVNDILSGDAAADVSHAGGEFTELLAIEDGLLGPSSRRPHVHDYRTRRNRTQRRTDAFEQQIHALVDAYMGWMLAMGGDGVGGTYSPPSGAQVQGQSVLIEMDMFRDSFVTASVIRYGLIPCAPYQPSAAFTIRALEFFRVSHNRCPHLSVHTFVKSLCDLHCSPFRPYISHQFSICFDLYLCIRTLANERVQVALDRNHPDWQLRHVCPPCTYKLQDEPKLEFSLLYTVDGNDSLKRIIRRETAPIATGNDNATQPILGDSSKLTDNHQAGMEIYLTNAQVDEWSKEMLAALCPAYNEDDTDDNPCAERWRNMKTTLTAKMWGVFQETGLFLALCRHGFVLMLADMVRSGELSKYPFAIVAKMLDIFGPDLALGYDIGCRFKTTLANSPLGKKASENNHRCLVGAFHGHAHNRLCQSQFLATYVKGLGLEDLEGCERFFAKSNALAGSIRHASTFHRRQAISEYATYNDRFEIYQNLSTFLHNNYKQALAILDTKPAMTAALSRIGAESGAVVEGWLREEEAYLWGLSKEPLEETLEMEYYKLVLNIRESAQKLAAVELIWSRVVTPATQGQKDSINRSTETARRHTREMHKKDLRAVQAMEKRMGIITRWEPECPEWKSAAEKVSMQQYQRCLDSLEGLIVARMFELTKMNMSQTGYSLRKHIANALKSCSAAIRTALIKYNAAAADLDPPRRSLSWEEVVEYAFLADFDLLRDTRQDIQSRPWATPTAHLAMDGYFKLLRAAEEIMRLNVEIPHFATFIRDEDKYLRAKEEELRPTQPALAFQIRTKRLETGRFNAHHANIINQTRQLNGYSGGALLGTHVPEARNPVVAPPMPPLPAEPVRDGMVVDEEVDMEDDLEQEQAGEDQDEAVLGAYESVLEFAWDEGVTHLTEPDNR